MNEEWKTILNYPNYAVSNFGEVKVLNYRGTGKEKILSQSISKFGYKRIMLSNGKTRKMFQTHRLVATYFVPNPNNYPIINHIDENKLNNVYTNLEWCTYLYNNNYGNRNRKSSKSKEKPINQYDLDGNLLATWSSALEIERVLHINHSNIAGCCKQRLKTCGGYIWQYVK